MHNDSVSESGTQPLTSIVVLAYNHLDYTRQCVESILRHTAHLDYELITVDNGSTDGTKEYLESVPAARHISFAQNIGVDKAINHGIRAARGKYVLNVSNDIVVTARWLDNLVAILETDPRVGMAVPVCNASCNYQQINIGCTTMEAIQRYAERHNVSDPGKWEERLKLSTYLGIYRNEIMQTLGGFDEDFNPGCYDDDAICFSIRRMGYKVILARDTFVHHYGARSFNAEYEKDKTLQIRNLRLFMSKFNADPYLAGLIDCTMVDTLTYDGGQSASILGIGSSYGSTALHVKNNCRYFGCKQATLSYLASDRGKMADLKTICDRCEVGAPEDAAVQFAGQSFDFIVLETDTRLISDRPAFYHMLYGMLNPGGQLACTAADDGILFETMGVLYGLGARFGKQANHYYLSFIKSASS